MKKKVLITLVAAFPVICCVASLCSNKSMFSTKAVDCLHTNVNHYDALEPSLIKAGHSEYWVCCDCHESFSDASCTQLIDDTSIDWTNPSDGRYVEPLGVSVTDNIMYSGSVSSEDAPEGYAFDKVYEQSGYQGQFIFNETFNIQKYSKVSFAVKAGTWLYLGGGLDVAYGPDSWKLFELDQTAENVWSIYSADLNGEFTLKFSGVEGKTIKAITGFGGDASTYYLTNLRCLEREITTDIVSMSSVSSYSTVNMTVPYGYTTATRGTVEYISDGVDVTNNNIWQGNPFLADISMERYDEVSFAFKTLNRQLCDSSWGNPCAKDTWYICTVSAEQGGTYASEITDIDGNVKFGYTGKASFREALPYYNFGGDPMVWISTEVRGTKQAQTLDTVVIDDNAIGGNGATVTAAAENAPKGFETVAKWDGSPDSGSMHGMLYSDVDLRRYSSVSFAIKTTGYFVYDGWSTVTDNCLWNIITLTNNNDDTWNMVAKNLKGETIYTIDNLSSYKGTDPGVYTNYALNTILYGIPGTGYIPFKKDGVDLEVYATELRGVEKPFTSIYGDAIEDCAMNANGVTYTKASVAAPEQFKNVYAVAVNGERADTKFFSHIRVANYSKVAFGLKLDGGLLLDGWAEYTYDKVWVIVEIVHNGNANYTVTYSKESGENLYTNVFDWPDSVGEGYTPGGLNSVMFKANTYASSSTDSLYVTELRGISVNEGFTEVDSCAIGGNNARFQEGYTEASISNPFGFTSVHKLDKGSSGNLHGQYYSNVSLKGYSTVRFAFLTNGDFNLDNNDSVGAGTWMLFELTDAGSDTWNLKVILANGSVKYTANGLGAFRGEDPGVYSNYALNAILYGIPGAGYSASCSDENTVLYATEVIAL